MDIFEELRADHAAIRSLLDEIIESSTGLSPTKASEGREWPEALQELKTSLFAHNRAEEAVFYEALSQIPHRDELAEIKTEEHHMGETVLDELIAMNPEDSDWDIRLDLLKNQIESHVAEEETLVFSILKEHTSEQEALRMAQEFEKLREELRTQVPVAAAPQTPTISPDLRTH